MTRVAIVTGGTRGIGAAISQRLNKQGCHVAAFFTETKRLLLPQETIWRCQPFAAM
jgi:NAD(P)-dependent dehydrogenase (short-subunit alcohol dehydrogenase family)